MVKLSEEATEELSAALQGLNEAEAEQPVEEQVEHYADDAGEAEFETESYENGELQEYDETDVEEGHSVPYGRFSSVIAARNNATEEAQELRGQLEAMQAQYEQMRQFQQMMGQQQQPQHQEPEHEMPEGMDPHMAQMQSRMHEMSVQQEQFTLERELAAVAESHPNVDPEVLLNAVIQDPSVDIAQVAEVYSGQIAEIEEAAINRFLANLDLDEAEDESYDIPPEVASRQGRQRTLSSAQGNKPQTMEQAHEALSNWLQNN
tara:strand:+ start:13636 stop:14421 length:786 start_codon:yes stop_codon:yes gene_type:complete